MFGSSPGGGGGNIGGLAFATWNPADKDSSITLSGGNLIATATASSGLVRSTLGKSSGKWYWEITNSASQGSVTITGIAKSTASLAGVVGDDANGWGYVSFNGNKYTNFGGTAYGNSWGAGDILSIALDMDNGKVWWAKNGTWQASGDPAAGTNAAFTGLSGTIFAATSPVDVGKSHTANFGATAFSFTPPTGFSAGLYS